MSQSDRHIASFRQGAMVDGNALGAPVRI